MGHSWPGILLKHHKDLLPWRPRSPSDLLGGEHGQLHKSRKLAEGGTRVVGARRSHSASGQPEGPRGGQRGLARTRRALCQRKQTGPFHGDLREDVRGRRIDLHFSFQDALQETLLSDKSGQAQAEREEK